MHIGLAWLKWLTVVVPTAFMAVFTLWGYSFLDRLSLAGVGAMIVVVVVGVAAFLFSRFVFSSIQGLQQTVLQRNRELSALYSVTREASKSLDPAQVMTGALEVVAEVFQAQRAGIFLLNPETGQLTLTYGYGLPSQLLGAVAAGDVPDCACQEAVSTLQPVLISDGTGDGRCCGLGEQPGEPVSCMSVPIDSHGRAMAAMFVAGRRTQGYARADARLFDSLSRRIATALENARLYRQTQTLAVLQERERISREIHDGLAQAFSALNLRVNMLARLLEPGQSDTARQEVHEIGQMVEHAYKDLRDVILGLRTSPATGSGFISSLNEYVGKFSRQSGVQVHLVGPDREITLSAAIEVQLIRIIQEALTNVRKHAPGSHAWLRFKGGEGTMQVAIEDDGPGFDPAAVAQDGQPHYGLQTMRERALGVGGELQLETAPGQGTKVTVTVPMSEPRRDA